MKTGHWKGLTKFRATANCEIFPQIVTYISSSPRAKRWWDKGRHFTITSLWWHAFGSECLYDSISLPRCGVIFLGKWKSIFSSRFASESIYNLISETATNVTQIFSKNYSTNLLKKKDFWKSCKNCMIVICNSMVITFWLAESNFFRPIRVHKTDRLVNRTPLLKFAPNTYP